MYAMKHTKHTYSQITPEIFIGTNMCCDTHFQDLKKLGITADIDLEGEEMDFSRPEGMESYLWLPVEDHLAPTFDQLEMGIAVLERSKQ